MCNSAVIQAQLDSLHNIKLPEVIAIAENQIEKPTHTVFIPTSVDKGHSTNAFDLIINMNISGLDISLGEKEIFNNVGQKIVLCINGIEVSKDEISSLRSKDIQSIEFQRNATGKYHGRGGVLNFRTVQYKYGGNVYLSLMESFLYNHGEYLASVDYTRDKSRLALTYSNNWDIVNNKQIIKNQYSFINENILNEKSEGSPLENKNLVNILNLRYSNTGDNYRFSVLGAISDDSPYSKELENSSYSGLFKHISIVHNTSDSYNKAISAQTEYTLWLPNEQILDITALSIIGKNNYRFAYKETEQQDLLSEAQENNMKLSGTLQYFNTLKNGMNLSSVLNYYYTRYNNNYQGSISEKQKLQNHILSARFGVSNSTSNLYYYFTAGISNTYTRLNVNSYNYFNPTCFYGINYNPNSNMSVLLNGFYTHTFFDLSYKNTVSLPISFFKVMKGNPDIKPIKVFSNTMEYNYHKNKTSLTASYMCYIYFDNILYIYEADNSHIYKSVSNDGNFYGNMLTVSLGQKMWNDKINISLKCIEEYNIIQGKLYNIQRNVIRGKFKIDYILRNVRMGVEASTPYKALDIREPFYIKNRMSISLHTSWTWRDLKIEAWINNLFDKYAITERYMKYTCFNMNIKEYNMKNGRSLGIKLVYNFGYGKKVKRQNNTIDNFVNSVIMKP